MDIPNKNSMGSVFYYSFNFLKDVGFLLFLALLKFKLWAILGIVSAYFIISLLYIIKWKSISFYIENDSLIYNSGIFSKKNMLIHLDKITTIDLSQNLILMAFNLHKLKIDSGALSDGAEIEIILKRDCAQAFKDKLLNFSKELKLTNTENGLNEDTKDLLANYNSQLLNNSLENTPSYEISSKEILIMALTKNFFLAGLGFFFSCFAFADDVFSAFELNFDEMVNSTVNSDIFTKDIFILILLATALFIVILGFCLIVSTLTSFLKYYKFKVYKLNDHINIEYGLLEKKTYSLPINNINALTYKQSFFRRFFKLYTLEISTIGYGDESKEEAILFPIGKEEKLQAIVNDFLPHMNFTGTMNYVPKRALFRYFRWNLLYALIIILCAIWFKPIIWALLLLPIFMLSSYLSYKDSALGYNDSTLMITNGGLSLSKIILPISRIESIAKKSNFLLNRKKLCDYNIDYKCNSLSQIISIRGLDTSHFRDLEKKLDFN